MPFCDACKKLVEWHPSIYGKDYCIDPDPTPQGNLMFAGGMKLAFAEPGAKPRMYTMHLATCSEKAKLRAIIARKGKLPCDWPDCDRTDSHRHCHLCGSTEHLSADCTDAG